MDWHKHLEEVAILNRRIADLESQLAELRQGGEAVGEVVLESMGVPGSDAQIVRFHMYKEIPPVGTKLYTRPQPAIPPGYAAVPEADPHYVAARILATLGFAQEVSKEPGADRRRDKIAEMIEECFNTAADGRIRHSISMPEGIHPDTAKLVKRFARALANKLHAAEKKYGYDNGWMRPDWMDECREHLIQHIAKGDPRDVAAYCAFLWHHGESTAAPSAPVAEKWQPIETASAKLLPPTGCAISDRVLIAYDDFDGDEVVGKLVSVGRLRRGGRGDATTEYWDSPSFDEIYEPPTHWMPLPAAPKEQGK